MSETLHVVPLMAIYDKFGGVTPPKYSEFQVAGDGLQFGEGVVQDKVGVRWYTKKTDSPEAIVYEKKLLKSPYLPNYDYLRDSARMNATYGFLGIIDPEDTQTTGKEELHASTAAAVTIHSIMVFCCPPMRVHDRSIAGRTSDQEVERKNKHNMPIRDTGSLVVDQNGVLVPLCIDGPQMHNVPIEYGYTSFLRVSPLIIPSSGRVIFERLTKDNIIEDSIVALRHAQEVFEETRERNRRNRSKDYFDESDDFEEPSDVVEEPSTGEKPTLKGRKLRRARHFRRLD